MSFPRPRIFGCKPCNLLFSTLGRGIAHLQSSPVHTALNLDLIEEYGGDYRTGASRMLTSFVESSVEEHADAIADANASALIRAAREARNASSTVKRRMAREIAGENAEYTESPVRAKRTRREGGVVVDNSIRSQTAGTRKTTNIFLSPIKVRVTLPSRSAGLKPEYFRFEFERDRHDTVDKLVRAVIAGYPGKQDVHVHDDMVARAAERLMMKVSTKDGQSVGGWIRCDDDLLGLVRFRGKEMFGEMEIG